VLTRKQLDGLLEWQDVWTEALHFKAMGGRADQASSRSHEHCLVFVWASCLRER